MLKLSHLPLLRIVTAFVFTFNILGSTAPFYPALRPAYAEGQIKAEDLHAMMTKLMDPGISAIDKKRLTAVIFYNSDVYRKAVMLEQFKADSPEVKAFLEQKALMQQEVIQKMGVKYKNQYGEVLKQPIIPFSYNNILSDDDIITGTGDTGRKLEGLYNEALNDHIKEHVGRPMTEADRKRVDVNGLAWNMTQEGAFEDFKHHEKYINPQSGFANQEKLIEGAKHADPNKRVKAYTFDDNGRLIQLPPDETVKAIERLEVDKPMLIPGIDIQKGTGGMSDFLRMAEMHKIKINGSVTVEQVQQFIRNQKYSQRVIGPFNAIGAKIDPELAQEYAQFIKLSDELRNQTTVRGVAQLLEKQYGTNIIGANGIIDYDKLTKAMLQHQEIQLTKALPSMMGAVMKSEAYKISEWLKTAKAADRRRLRKQIAITYAPMDDAQRKIIVDDLNKLDIDDADRKYLVQAVDGDAKQISRYADLLEIPKEDLVKRLNLEGANMAVVDFVEGKNVKVKAFTEAMEAQAGGRKFKEFLKSKTAQALNLDVMLDGAPSEKLMLASMLLLAATRAYVSYDNNIERWKAVAMSMFEMIPLVSATLRFSEMEYREAFKELACDVLPPLALAQLAGLFLNYAAQTVKNSFVDSVWEDLVDQALLELNDDDFEKTPTGFYRLKNRAGYFEYLSDVYPGFGKVAKLGTMILPEVEALMSRDADVQTNNAALHTLQWFESFDADSLKTEYVKQFDLHQLKNKMYEQALTKDNSKPVERVAAKIILDNARIEARLTEQVLEKFIDRIETAYTQKKGELTGDFDPSAIISATMAILKQDFDNPPEEINESPWGLERLEEEYLKNIGFLKDYQPPAGMEEIDLRRQMQDIVDGFREFIQKLIIVVMLYEESRSLDLRAFVYGGLKSLEPATAVLLGDQFRTGAALRVNSKRQMQKWALHYYVLTENGIEYLGGVSLNPQDYRGAEGLWVIEAPEKKTLLTVPNTQLIETFAQEGSFRLLPVIAFGDWKDPVQEAGLDALKNTIDYPEIFTKDKAAFAGTETTFTIERARISARVSPVVYRDEHAPVSVVLLAPDYAKEKSSEAEITVSAPENGPAPKIEPEPLKPLSLDPQQPAVARILLREVSKEGQYIVTVKADLTGLPKEAQPVEQTLLFEYTKTPNPTSPEETTEETATVTPLDPALLERLRELEGSAAALADETQALEKAIKSGQNEITKGTERVQKELLNIESKIGQMETLAQKIDQSAAVANQLAKECYDAAETAAALRGTIQDLVLKGCQEADTIKSSFDVDQLKSSLDVVRLKCASARDENEKFITQMRAARSDKRQIEEIQKDVSSAPGKRDAVKTALDEQKTLIEQLKLTLNDVENNVQAILAKPAEIAGIKGEAAGIVEQIKAAADPQDKAQKKIIKETDGLFAKITKHETKVTGAVDKAKTYHAGLGEKISSAEQQLNAAQNKFAVLPESLMGPQSLAQIEESAKDAGATVDAAELFEDAVSQSLNQCGKCLGASESLVAQRTSPQAQVARHDCSTWPGTVAKWNSDTNAPFCVCTPGNLWDEPLFKCVTEADYYVPRTDCSRYGANIHAAWDAKQRQALCYCNDGYEWNNARTACRVSAQAQISRTDCSMYPYTKPGWDAASESVLCFCVQGYYWDGSRCVRQQQPQYDPQAAQELINVLTGVINTVNNQGGTNTTTGTNTGGGWTNTGYQGGGSDNTVNTQSGLSDVSVSQSPTQITVWDHGTEDYDTVNIYLNNQLVQSNLVLRNAKQAVTLYLNRGQNTLVIEAVNEGDPEIIRRRNIPRGNAAAIEFSNVTQGKHSQTWILYTGQRGTLSIYY